MQIEDFPKTEFDVLAIPELLRNMYLEHDLKAYHGINRVIFVGIMRRKWLDDREVFSYDESLICRNQY